MPFRRVMLRTLAVASAAATLSVSELSPAAAHSVCASYDSNAFLPADFQFEKIMIVRSRAWMWGESVSAYANEDCLCRTRNPAIRQSDYPDTPSDAVYTCRPRHQIPVNLFKIY